MTAKGAGLTAGRMPWLVDGKRIVGTLAELAAALRVDVAVLERLAGDGALRPWGRNSSGQTVYRVRDAAQVLGLELGRARSPWRRAAVGRPKAAAG